MPVDEDLLAAAKTAGDRFAAAEREADVARAHYHHAVRRLHLAGASVRDVAHAMGMSHQRVQQIVQASGGTWWSSIWRGRKVRPDMVCSFCGLPSAQVSKLIAGPKVYICDACVCAVEQALRGEKPKEAAASAPMELVPFSSKVRCSFCRQKSRQVVLTHAGNAKASPELRIVRRRDKGVCNNCLDICRRILDDRSHAA